MLDTRAMVRFQFYTAYKVASQEMEVKKYSASDRETTSST